MSACRLLLLCALPALVGVGCGSVVSGRAGPVFLPTPRAVLAPAGGSAELACRVQRLGDRVVSWVRARDLQILAHAGAVFSADPRVAVAVAVEAGAAAGGGVTHTLRLERLRAADAGRYECQLNTDPKLSQIYNLTVVENEMPRVSVWAGGSREVRARAGGAATLACAARVLPGSAGAAPLRLAWLKGERVLQPQGGVSLDTERAAGRATSRLALSGLAARDAGRYTCRATAQQGDAAQEGGAPALQGEVDFTLIVLQDEDVGEMEAMQRDQSLPGGAGRATAARALLAAPLAALLAARYLAP